VSAQAFIDAASKAVDLEKLILAAIEAGATQINLAKCKENGWQCSILRPKWGNGWLVGVNQDPVAAIGRAVGQINRRETIVVAEPRKPRELGELL
jgi:hypothetical protein